MGRGAQGTVVAFPHNALGLFLWRGLGPVNNRLKNDKFPRIKRVVFSMSDLTIVLDESFQWLKLSSFTFKFSVSYHNYLSNDRRDEFMISNAITSCASFCFTFLA